MAPAKDGRYIDPTPYHTQHTPEFDRSNCILHHPQPGRHVEARCVCLWGTFSVDIAPEDGYGLHLDDQVHHLPRAGMFLPPGQKLEPGAVVTIPRRGEVVHGRIVGMNDEVVVLDANHELAGKTLHFEIEILDVI